MKRQIFLILFVLLLVAPGWAEKINITAQSIKRYPQEHLVVAQGNVKILYQDVKLVGERVSLYTHTKDLIAEGNVVLYQEKNYLKCERLEFNLLSKTGVAYRARGLFSPYYYVQGEKIEKVSKKRYVIKKGTLTTCSPRGGKGCKKTPDWCFKAKKFTIDVGGYARGGPVTFWIKKIPILYTPYLKVPVYKKRKTGFLIPTPGYDSHKGVFLSIPFFWAISDSQDATLTVTPYSKTGLRGTLEYRYIIDKDSRGYFWGDWMERKRPRREKWNILFKHHQIFKNDWRLLAKVDIRSDERYSKNYLDEFERRVERYTDSYITLTKNWWDAHFSAEFRGKKDLEYHFGETTYKLPEIEFSLLDRPLLGSPLYLEAENSLLRYEKKSDTYHISHQLVRVDLHPALSIPLSPKPWISITPKAGLRETWYSKSLEDDGNVRSNSNSRLLPDFSARMRGPLFTRLFGMGKDQALKHLVVPEVEYQYIPRKYQGDIPIFDAVDRILPQDTFTYSLTNWLYLYSKGSSKKLVKVKFEQSYYTHFDEESSPTNRPFSDLLVDVDTSILPGVELDTQATYNVYGEGINTWDVQANISRGIFRLHGSYHYKKRPEERFLIVEPGVKLGNFDIWNAWRYDLKDSYPREVEWKVLYQSACWSLTLDYFRIDNRNNNAANERKFSFLITLKGIGTVGKKR